MMHTGKHAELRHASTKLYRYEVERRVSMRFRIQHFTRTMGVILTLVVLLAMTSLPAAAHWGFSSGLKIQLGSPPPRQVMACETFKVTYDIYNSGRLNASNVNVLINVPDPFEVMYVKGVPVNLGPGKYAMVTAVIKVVAFVPGESRQAWVRAIVTSDLHNGADLHPIQGKNEIVTTVWLKSKPVDSCP
jgi:hypothetical protein